MQSGAEAAHLWVILQLRRWRAVVVPNHILVARGEPVAGLVGLGKLKEAAGRVLHDVWGGQGHELVVVREVWHAV